MADEVQEPRQNSPEDDQSHDPSSPSRPAEGVELPVPADLSGWLDSELPEFPWMSEASAPKENPSFPTEWPTASSFPSAEPSLGSSPDLAAQPFDASPPGLPTPLPPPLTLESDIPSTPPIAEEAPDPLACPAAVSPPTQDADLPWESQPAVSSVGPVESLVPSTSDLVESPGVVPALAVWGTESNLHLSSDEKVATGLGEQGVSAERIPPAHREKENTLTYAILVQLTGTEPFIDVRVEHHLPHHVRYAGSNPPAKVHGNCLSWHLGKQEPGAKLSLQVNVELPPGREKTWDGQAAFQIFYYHRDTHQTRVIAPRLALTCHGPESVQVGDHSPFHLEVRNTGNWSASGVRLVIELPQGLQPVQGSAREAYLGSIAPGEAVKLTIPTKAVQQGRWEATVAATADDDVKATAKTSVVVSAPALELRLGPRPRFVVGEEISYRLELSNPGLAPATQVRLTNTLPGELDFVSASAGGTFDSARREVSWLLPSLPPGGSQFFTVKLTGQTPGDFVHQANARADRDLAATAQGEISYEIGDQGSSGILEKFVALMDGAEDTAQGLDAVAAPIPSRRIAIGGKEDKYIVFSLAGTEYAVAMSSVLEVAPPLNITPLPNVPDWMIGVTNMRGDVVSIVDLRVFLGLERSAQGQARRMLVMRTSQEDMVSGLIVDRVRGICRLPKEQITLPTSPFEDPVAPYLRGVSEYNGNLLVLLDADRLLLSADMKQFEPV